MEQTLFSCKEERSSYKHHNMNFKNIMLHEMPDTKRQFIIPF